MTLSQPHPTRRCSECSSELYRYNASGLCRSCSGKKHSRTFRPGSDVADPEMVRAKFRGWKIRTGRMAGGKR